MLEAIRTLNMEKEVRFYQASTSEMFGKSPPPQMKKLYFNQEALMLLQIIFILGYKKLSGSI